MVGPQEVIGRLVQLKQGADLHTPTLNQMLMYELSQGVLEQLIPQIRAKYRTNRDLMSQALQEHLSGIAHWNRPEGGMFLWLQLPQHLDSVELLKQAVEEKVAFVPGQPFYADGTGHNTLRLSFSVATPEQIQSGIARLAKVIKAASQPLKV